MNFDARSHHDEVSHEEAVYSWIDAAYAACDTSNENIADCWVQTLNRKGKTYSLRALQEMRRPGNFVTLQINIFDYLIDDTRLDLSDPIVRRLVANGEPSVGYPMQDVKFIENSFSSVFLRHLSVAADIIRHLEERGVTHPRILEIGGGQGLLLAALRGWYGDRLTVLAVDIPETLYYQSYYLLSSFPDAPATYRATEAAVEIVEGGFNFVNAYTLAGQDYVFDVAVNSDSMQEMTATVVEEYIRFIEDSIAQDGVFFFRNSYGHAMGSILNPSDYPFDPYWKLIDCEFGESFAESSPGEFIMYVLARTDTPSDMESRREQLRTLWFGQAAGLIEKTTPAWRQLINMDCSISADAAGAIFSESDFSSPGDTVPSSRRWRRIRHLWDAQKKLIGLMRDAGDGAELPAAAVSDIAAALCEFPDAVKQSDYWSGYSLAAALALGVDADTATSAIQTRLDDPRLSPYWQLRFAWLFSRTGNPQPARMILEQTNINALDEAWRPMASLLWHSVGDAARARSVLLACSEAAPSDVSGEIIRVYYRTSIAIGQPDLAIQFFEPAATHASTEELTSLAITAAKAGSAFDEISHAHIERLRADGETSDLAALLYHLGQKDDARNILSRATERAATDYFELAGVVPKWLLLGGVDQAIDCMERSAALRNHATRHLEYMANVSFDNGLWALAEKWYGAVLAKRPYDHIYRGLLAYARLPKPAKESGHFGRHSDQRLVFQKDHSFYYANGPQVR